MKRYYFLYVSIVILSGCVSSHSPPAQIVDEPINTITLDEAIDNNKQFIGQAVRWGGVITHVVDVGPKGSSVLHLQIREYPLNDRGEPNTLASSGGGFIARLQAPYKRASYYKNRRVTIVGRLSGLESHPLVDGSAAFLPIIDVKEKYAWESLDKEERGFWSQVFYRVGVSIRRGNVGFGVGVVFH